MQGEGVLFTSLLMLKECRCRLAPLPADEDERKHAGRLIEAAAGKAGRPRKNVRRPAADKGYDADALRNFLKNSAADSTEKECRKKTRTANARQRATISSRTNLLMAAKKVPALSHPMGKIARLFRCVSLLGSLFYPGSTISGIGSSPNVQLLKTMPNPLNASCGTAVSKPCSKGVRQWIGTVLLPLCFCSVVNNTASSESNIGGGAEALSLP